MKYLWIIIIAIVYIIWSVISVINLVDTVKWNWGQNALFRIRIEKYSGFWIAFNLCALAAYSFWLWKG